MLQAARQSEVRDYLQARSSLVDENGRKLIVPNGSFPRVRWLRGWTILSAPDPGV
jgi:hypothetical protein